VVISGAKIDRLLHDTVVRLRTLPPQDNFLVRLAAGINERTKKEYHRNGCEVVLNPSQDLWNSITHFKEKIRDEFPNTLVSLCTIPPIHFQAATQFYLQKRWLRESRLTDENRKEEQEELRKTLTHINHLITEENKKEQDIKDAGMVTPSQLYMHQDIERTFTKKKKDGSRKTTKHIRLDTLVDGIHPTKHVSDNWFELTHHNFFKEIHKICFPEWYAHK
jgi:hypothetical protein